MGRKTKIEVTNNDISLENIDVKVPKKTLLENTDLKLTYGRKYGLIGINGIGKSTLLKYIYNRTLNVPKSIDIYYVDQEVKSDDKITVFETVISSNTVRQQLVDKANKLEKQIGSDEKLIEQYNNVLEELNAINANKDESIVRTILHGLGFTPEGQNKVISSFSGGWRMRISLAKALYLKPTVLLLDEPTNHLDLNANIWLTDYLDTQWKNTLFVVSHDKDFLNEVCTDIVHMSELKLNYYTGNYDQYKKMYVQQIKKRDSDWNKYRKALKNIKKKGNKDEIERFIKKKKVDPPPKPYKIHIEFGDVLELKNPIIEMTNVNFKYEDKYIIEGLTINIDKESRMTIVGNNGVGKSTFIKLLVKELNPINEDGDVHHDNRLRFSYYHQHSIDYLPLDLTPIEYIYKLSKLDIQIIRRKLGSIGLEGKLHNTPIKLLSGGQKSRVSFVEMQLTNPHMIILDEPTNHLDIETVEALIDAINKYNGCVIMVTHDIELITKTYSDIYELKDGSLEKTTYEKYRDKILDEE